MFTNLSSWNTLYHPARLENVFQNRQKEYGAYALRGNYEKVLSRALFITLLWVSGFMAFLILSSKGKQESQPTEITLIQEVVLPEKTTLPEPKVLPPPSAPEKSSGGKKFTNPLVRNEVINDSVPPQEKLFISGVISSDSVGTDSSFTDNFPVHLASEPASKPFTWVEEMPRFPGGDSEMLAYLGKAIRYPEKAVRNGISGTVYLQFVVNENGQIDQLRTLNSIGGGCDEEALRVVRSMPAWRPGKQNGKAVAVEYMLPIRFSLR